MDITFLVIARIFKKSYVYYKNLMFRIKSYSWKLYFSY